MTTIEKPVYSVIGTRPIRPDGAEKVTGKAQYGADIRLPGMIFGKVLRSPHAHARVVSVDTSAAASVPGVMAVVTRQDLPTVADKIEELGESAVNLKEVSDNILASDKVLYRGHAVAAVAATSPHIAEQALGLIKVEYEVLPPVLDVRDAMRPDAPLLNPARRTKTLMTGELSERPSNIATYNRLQGGDVAAAFAAADVVVEREFRTKMVHQGYIEPQNATANWNSDGTLTIWTSTQGSFAVRGLVAEVLQVPDLAGQGRPHGDRWRVRRQVAHLRGPRRRAAFEEERTPGEDCHEPDRRVRSDRTDERFVHQAQGRRQR